MLIWETEIAHLWFSVESKKTIGIELKRKKIERGSKGLLLCVEGVSLALLSRRGKGRDRICCRQKGSVRRDHGTEGGPAPAPSTEDARQEGWRRVL